jgi:pimeloyl-ACP methyl ester carboxylesterase
VCIVALLACSTPAERAERSAEQLGFQSSVVRGRHFDHRVYTRPGLGSAERLHVYLGGDGSPLRAFRNTPPTRPPDPTPEDPLALRLMALDPAPGFFLGRPCYHGVGACQLLSWTLGRYGEPVVASLVAAARRVAHGHGARELVLIGYSGGGALAMLMAERMPEVTALVTVAGNLDPDAWTAHHGFTPLAESLNPAQRPPLRSDLAQLHLTADGDERVPPALTRAAIERQPGARHEELPDFDHDCCWEQIWPGVLGEIGGAED